MCVTKSVCVRAEACGEGSRGCCGEAKDDSGESDEVVDVKDGEATSSGTVLIGAKIADTVTGGGGGGGGGAMTVVGAVIVVTVVGSRRIGLGEESRSRTPTKLPASLWSGDIAPSLLDSSSYCT